MTTLAEVFERLDNLLREQLPEVAESLQAGLNRAEINQQVEGFSWVLPEAVYEFYQWHNGLSGQTSKKNLIEKLLRQKDKWHGELSGRENELHLNCGDRSIAVKFMPLEYALAGHRHLKLGKCPLNLLPIFVLTEEKNKLYGMIRLDTQQPTVHCLNGAKVPPKGIDEAFLLTQVQYSNLTDLFLLLIDCCEVTVRLEGQSLDQPQYQIDRQLFNQIHHKYRIN